MSLGVLGGFKAVSIWIIKLLSGGHYLEGEQYSARRMTDTCPTMVPPPNNVPPLNLFVRGIGAMSAFDVFFTHITCILEFNLDVYLSVSILVLSLNNNKTKESAAARPQKNQVKTVPDRVLRSKLRQQPVPGQLLVIKQRVRGQGRPATIW